MDLDVVGRHALLFDDDATAAIVNSGHSLVDWHSLQIDRYDVRHLLSSPPPSRRRNRNSKLVLLADSSLEFQLDHERYLDLPSHPDQPDVELEEHRTDALGYHTVAFLYGDTGDSVDKKNADAGIGSFGFLPHFPIPNEILQSLPPTEKVHQIIARTALFVSKHGGQSEIILRVKQGDNPTFGFLMPGHRLHAYFRFLVEHPELLHSQSDGTFQDEQKKSASDSYESNGVNGALTLLGSAYGYGEEDEGNDDVKPEKDVSHDSTYSPNHSFSHSSKKIESQADAAKDEPSKNLILPNREKVLTVKNSLITTSKSGTAKCMEERSRLLHGAAVKAKSLIMGMTSSIEPVHLEPPPELKRLIDNLVELIMRHGRQFEATLLEQDSEHGRFPFLHPSNQYHFYYLKVLQTAQESTLNYKGINSGKDGPLGCRVDKKASILEETPLESDRKEKFKMVIGKSKKETQEAEFKEAQQERGMDAAAAAAILHAATRGVSNSNLQTISTTSSSGLSSKPDNDVKKLSRSRSCNICAVAPNSVAVKADIEAHLTKEQKLKAERLKRAKMFVAMLRRGEVAFTAGTSCGSSLEPQESGVSRSAGEINLDGQKREASLAPPDVDGPATGEKPEQNYFCEHNERLSKRKYRLRSGVCENEDDGDEKEHNGRHSKGKCRSRSRRHDGCDENDNAIEMEQKHHRRHQTHSSSKENEDEGESDEEDRDHKHYKLKHRSHDRQVDECEEKYKEDKNHKYTRKKRRRRSHSNHSYSDESEDESEISEEDRDSKHYKSKHRSHSRQEDKFEDKYREEKNHQHTRKTHLWRSRKKRSSERDLRIEDEYDDYEIDEKRSGRRHRSSHGSRDKHRHSRRDGESQNKLKPDTSSGDEHKNQRHMDRHNNDDEKNELEEGEISSRLSEESRRFASGNISLETSTDISGSHQRAPSQPSETSAEVPDDLRAKIRALLMSSGL